METRSKEFKSRCITTKFVSQTSLCFPLILIDTQIANKSRVRKGSFFHTNKTNLVESNMVLRVISFVYKKANIFASTTKCFSKPLRRTSSTFSKSNIAISSMDHYMPSLAEEGILKRTSGLIISSKRKSRNQEYSSSWNKWLR